MSSLKVRLGLAGGLVVLTTALVLFAQTDATKDADRPDAGPQTGDRVRTAALQPDLKRTLQPTLRDSDEQDSDGFRFAPPGADTTAGSDDRSEEVPVDAPLSDAFERLLASEYDAARRIAEPHAAQGNPDARHLIGYLYERGLGVSRDLGKALSLYSEAAADGSTDAMLALGDLAMGTTGVQRNIDKAIGWYRMGIDHDDPRAQSRLGAIYADPNLGRRDMERALTLFERAAAKDDPDAHYALGVVYLEGDTRPLNYEKAAGHFEAAGKAGHAPAAYNLGVIYDTPYIGPPDAYKAAEWFTRAANGGYGPAMTALGLFANRGDAPGQPADWFEKAARAGDPHGRFLFAVALAEGDDREKDPARARELANEVLTDPAAEDMLKANARALLASLDKSAQNTLRLRN